MEIFSQELSWYDRKLLLKVSGLFVHYNIDKNMRFLDVHSCNLITSTTVHTVRFAKLARIAVLTRIKKRYAKKRL